MATTSVDISNRAINLLGLKKTISSMTQDSEEAKACNLIYTPVLNWCIGLTNWNFSRKTAILTQLRAVAPPVGTWTVASPSPPWLYEYGVPTDFVRARLITNSTHADTSAWDGEPQRFQVASSNPGNTAAKVILSNQSGAILIYNAQITDCDLWSTYFTQVMVEFLASELAMALTGSLPLRQNLKEIVLQTIMFAIIANRNEGLVMDDLSPEWIIARGLEYPNLREAQKVQPNDNQR